MCESEINDWTKLHNASPTIRSWVRKIVKTNMQADGFYKTYKCTCTIHNLNKLMQVLVMMTKTYKINVNDQQTQDNKCS